MLLFDGVDESRPLVLHEFGENPMAVQTMIKPWPFYRMYISHNLIMHPVHIIMALFSYKDPLRGANWWLSGCPFTTHWASHTIKLPSEWL